MRLIKRLIFLRDYFEFRRQAKDSKTHFHFGKFYPCLDEKSGDSGDASGHYFHQDLLIANRVFVNEPKRHVDVGSRIDGFVAHVASFREIEVFDIRPLKTPIQNIVFRKVDLMSDDFNLKDYCDSNNYSRSPEFCFEY